jgi:hypothetical protein
MKMRRVMVVKPHKYGTRHMVAGEEYEVPARHALALLAGKKVRYAEPHKRPAPSAVSPRPPGEPPAAPVRAMPTPEPVVVAPEPAEIDRLRMQANELGIEVDRRWGVVRLQHEIHQARG